MFSIDYDSGWKAGNGKKEMEQNTKYQSILHVVKENIFEAFVSVYVYLYVSVLENNVKCTSSCRLRYKL